MRGIKERRFGVELEFNCPGYNRYNIRDAIREAGFTSWLDCDIHADGSGIEIPSPVLCGKSGLSELKEFTAFLRELGGNCTGADGLHVHHEAGEFVDNKPLLYRLLKSWNENHKHHEKFVGANRREGGRNAHWCRPPDAAWVESLVGNLTTCTRYCCEEGYYDEWDDDYEDGKSQSLNINPLYRLGTVEIRLHEGTLDYDKIEAWVLYGQSFIESVLRRKRPMRCAESHELLLNRIKAPAPAKRKLLAVAG